MFVRMPGASTMHAEHVADAVSVDVFQFQGAKAFLEPFCAGCLSERRSGDARHLHLPTRELSFLGAQPGEGDAGFWQRSESRDLLLDRVGHWRHFRARTGGHRLVTSSYNVWRQAARYRIALEAKTEMRALRSISFGFVIVLATACAPLVAQLHFAPVNSQIVEQRLKSYKGNDSQREANLKNLFQSAGCSEGKLIEQPVKGLKQANVICILAGTADAVIVVGAHFDHVDRGDGVVDNWSGASMLPSLYQALNTEPRKHTFIFVAFAGEEIGLVGSRFYVSSLTSDQVKKIDAMVNMDTLALGPTEVWVSRSDPKLVRTLNGAAQALKLPLTGVNVDRVGESDEESFIDRKVPTITIHSLTQETLRVLHSSRDNYSAVHFDDYYNSYRLLCGYLALLDDGVAGR